MSKYLHPRVPNSCVWDQISSWDIEMIKKVQLTSELILHMVTFDTIEAHNPCSITFLIGTPTYEWYVAWCVAMNGYSKTSVQKRLDHVLKLW